VLNGAGLDALGPRGDRRVEEAPDEGDDDRGGDRCEKRRERNANARQGVGALLAWRMHQRQREQPRQAPEGDVPTRRFAPEEGEVVDAEEGVAAEAVHVDDRLRPEDGEEQQRDERGGGEASLSVDRHRTTFRSSAPGRRDGIARGTARSRWRGRGSWRS